MTSIKAECPCCGGVRLVPDDVIVRVCAEDGQGAYRFRCPICSGAAIHDASPAICALLRQAGCVEEVWHLPAELTEVRSGPAFTSDDLIDFHILLQSEDWTEQLTGTPRDV